jgi:hypothetical protein
MKAIPIALVVLQCAAFASAQSAAPPPAEVRIVVGGFQTQTNGAERNQGISHTLYPTIGKTFPGEWSMYDCGYLELNWAHKGFKEGATTGWAVDVTPLRVVDRAITFRLHWARFIDKGKDSGRIGEDVEVTLRPGEERTIDRVLVPAGAKTLDGKACQTSAAALRVSVESNPMAELERRLIAADLWLVERLPNGSERSQPLSVRGLPNEAIPFYFDSVVDGQFALDIFGELTVRPEEGGLEVAFQARSRWGESSFDWRRGAKDWPTQLESVIHVKAQEIVEVTLPKLGEKAGPFATRAFSIRIRARQLR